MRQQPDRQNLWNRANPLDQILHWKVAFEMCYYRLHSDTLYNLSLWRFAHFVRFDMINARRALLKSFEFSLLLSNLSYNLPPLQKKGGASMKGKPQIKSQLPSATDFCFRVSAVMYTCLDANLAAWHLKLFTLNRCTVWYEGGSEKTNGQQTLGAIWFHMKEYHLHICVESIFKKWAFLLVTISLYNLT